MDHTASPDSFQVEQDASPIGMNLSGASRTPIALGTSPYLARPRLEMWAKQRGKGNYSANGRICERGIGQR